MRFYCGTCDTQKDSRNEDMADYAGEEIMCGSCVQDEIDKVADQTDVMNGAAILIEQLMDENDSLRAALRELI